MPVYLKFAERSSEVTRFTELDMRAFKSLSRYCINFGARLEGGLSELPQKAN